MKLPSGVSVVRASQGVKGKLTHGPAVDEHYRAWLADEDLRWHDLIFFTTGSSYEVEQVRRGVIVATPSQSI